MGKGFLMNSTDIADQLAGTTGLTKAEAKKAVERVIANSLYAVATIGLAPQLNAAMLTQNRAGSLLRYW